jgi:hypothetical protein
MAQHAITEFAQQGGIAPLIPSVIKVSLEYGSQRLTILNDPGQNPRRLGAGIF